MKRFKNLANCEKFYTEKYGCERFDLKYKEAILDLEVYPKLESSSTELAISSSK